MDYSLMSDEQIIKNLAEKLDYTRRRKHLKDTDVVKYGGASRRALSSFRNEGANISLSTFIKLLRGIGEINQLEKLLSINEKFSPTEKKPAIPEKRVRDTKHPSGLKKWGDEK